MHRRPSPSSSALGADRSVLVLGLGSWGTRVVDVLRADWKRLQVSDAHHALHAWNPSGNPGPDNLFQPFDAAAYLQEARHASLRRHLDHLSPQDIQTGGAELPAWGFVAMHHNASHGLLQHVRDGLDRLRAANPEGTLRCLVVGNVGEGSVAGGLTPLLLQLRSHLRLRKVDVEVWLTTGEGLAGSETAQRTSDLNCAAALDTLQRVVVGDGTFTLPGSEGLREDRSEHGPIVPQVMLLSGGVDDSSHVPGVLASILANNLLCLETTSLVERLQQERDLHGEDILERTWTDERGQRHPTRCATLHAGGVKADCMPEILHLRSVRAFIDTVTHSLARSAEDKARATALRCVASRKRAWVPGRSSTTSNSGVRRSAARRSVNAAFPVTNCTRSSSIASTTTSTSCCAWRATTRRHRRRTRCWSSRHSCTVTAWRATWPTPRPPGCRRPSRSIAASRRRSCVCARAPRSRGPGPGARSVAAPAVIVSTACSCVSRTISATTGTTCTVGSPRP